MTNRISLIIRLRIVSQVVLPLPISNFIRISLIIPLSIFQVVPLSLILKLIRYRHDGIVQNIASPFLFDVFNYFDFFRFIHQSFIAEHEFSDNGPSFGFHSDPPSTLQVHHDARSNQVGQSHLNQNGAALDLKQVPQNGTFSRTGLLQRFQSFSKHSISLSFRNRSQCFDEAIDDAPLTYFKSHHHTDSSDSNQDNQIYLSKSVTPIDSKPVNDFKAYGQGICSRTNLLRKFQSLSGKSISLSFRNWSRGSDDDESMDFNASISKCNFDTDIPEFNSRDNQNNRCCSSPLKFMLNRFKSMSGRSLVAWPVSAEESHHV